MRVRKRESSSEVQIPAFSRDMYKFIRFCPPPLKHQNTKEILPTHKGVLTREKNPSCHSTGVSADCSVLQCVAVCCSVLQCVAECCSVLNYVAVCCSVLQCVVVCCSVLQCVTVCCSVCCRVEFHLEIKRERISSELHLKMTHFISESLPRESLAVYVTARVAACVAVCCSACCSAESHLKMKRERVSLELHLEMMRSISESLLRESVAVYAAGRVAACVAVCCSVLQCVAV